MKILLVGPDRCVKGGISTVIDGIISSDLLNNHIFEHLSTHRDDLTKFGKLIYGIRSYLHFFKKIIVFKPHVIHVHSSFGASFYRKSVVMLISWLLRIKQINHIHGAEFDNFYTEANIFKKKLVKLIYNIPDTTIVLSKVWVNKLDTICYRSKVYCLNNFAVMPKDDLAKEIESYGSRKNEVLFLGEVGKRKGAYDIPAIAEKVYHHIKDVHFVVAGNGDIENIKEILRDKGCKQLVTFTGWIGPEQKKERMLKARVYLLPSYNEGLPMSVLEAMSYGLPIVSTIVGGIPELVQSDENGYLYQPGDSNGLADGIIKLLQDQNSAIEISLKNINKIEKEYSLDVFAHKLDIIYRQTMHPSFND